MLLMITVMMTVMTMMMMMTMTVTMNQEGTTACKIKSELLNSSVFAVCSVFHRQIKMQSSRAKPYHPLPLLLLADRLGSSNLAHTLSCLLIH